MTLSSAWTGADVDLLQEVIAGQGTFGQIGPRMCGGLRRLIGCDAVLWIELDAGRGRLGVIAGDPPLELPTDEAFREEFWQALWECDMCAYPDRTGDRQAILTLSDFYTPERLRRTRIYRLFMGAASADYAMAVVLPASNGFEARLTFLRSDGDFGARDRAFLALLRPHLLATYRRVREERAAVAALTPRQLSILDLVARGATSTQIAHRLQLSPRTVDKHLESICRRLGAHTRAEAVARVALRDARSADVICGTEPVWSPMPNPPGRCDRMVPADAHVASPMSCTE